MSAEREMKCPPTGMLACPLSEGPLDLDGRASLQCATQQVHPSWQQSQVHSSHPQQIALLIGRFTSPHLRRAPLARLGVRAVAGG